MSFYDIAYLQLLGKSAESEWSRSGRTYCEGKWDMHKPRWAGDFRRTVYILLYIAFCLQSRNLSCYVM